MFHVQTIKSQVLFFCTEVEIFRSIVKISGETSRIHSFVFIKLLTNSYLLDARHICSIKHDNTNWQVNRLESSFSPWLVRTIIKQLSFYFYIMTTNTISYILLFSDYLLYFNFIHFECISLHSLLCCTFTSIRTISSKASISSSSSNSYSSLHAYHAWNILFCSNYLLDTFRFYSILCIKTKNINR